MKIKLVSDIHTEFWRDNGKARLNSIENENIDTLVVAGDLSVGFKKRIKPNLQQLCDRFPNVVYVLGNHDNWKSSIEEREEQLRNLDSKISNLHFLENDRKKVDDKWFAGCTLWFSDSPQVRSNWIDFRQIEGGCHSIFKQNAKSQEFLKNEVQKGDIVVTHHLPSKKAIDPRWETSDLNCYFVCPMDYVMLQNEPTFWFFGHTHDLRHLMVWNTELMCNPMGYPHEGVPHDKDFLIDTEV